MSGRAGARKRPSLPASPTASSAAAQSSKRHAGERDGAAAAAPPRSVTITEEADEGSQKCGVIDALYEQQQAGTLCDVVFVVEGRRFSAHRNVMAALSPYLAAMLTGGMQEAAAQQVEITLQEVDADAFDALVTFAYTAQLRVVPAGPRRGCHSKQGAVPNRPQTV